MTLKFVEGARAPLRTVGLAVIRAVSFDALPFSQQLDGVDLVSNTGLVHKAQRISKRRAVNDLAWPLVVPRELGPNRKVCSALNQQPHDR